LSLLHEAKLLIRNAQYRIWKWKHPEASFKTYFAEIAERNLARGRAHPTLGANLSGGTYGVSGRRTFELLVQRYGIKRNDVCVEYGCGTLRVGMHAIEYLDPGCYWGLDIAKSLLEKGRVLIGNDLERRNSPTLRIISEETVSEAAAAKPKFLYSVSVLMHVHPDELLEYMENVVTIIGDEGLAIVAAQWTDRDTVQIGRQSWVHSLTRLGEALAAAGGDGEFVERDLRVDRVSGAIEIRRARA